MKRRHWTVLGVWCVAVLAADQVAKAWVVSNVGPEESVALVAPVLYLWHVTNTGGAFGLLRGMGGVMLMVSILVIVGLLLLAPRLRLDRSGWVRGAYGLVIGGALGNLVDRLARGHVVDYLDLRYHGRHLWPAFNLADSAITVGLVVLLVSQLIRPKEGN